jgi:hypothetical protein
LRRSSRQAFDARRVATVHEKGWNTLEDRPLVAAAQKELYLLVTIDGSLEFLLRLSRFAPEKLFM